MRLGFRIGTGIALSLALFAGDMSTLSLSPAPASAQRYGGHGYYGGRGGYYGHRHYGGGIGLGGVLFGAAILGGAAAIASSGSGYDYGYDAYQTYPPVYYAPPVAVYPPVAAYDGGPEGAYGDPQAQGYDGYDQSQPPAQVQAQTDPVEQCSRAAERDAQSHGGMARVIGIDHVEPRQTGARVNGTLEISSGGDRDGNHTKVDRAHFDCTAQYGQITALRLS